MIELRQSFQHEDHFNMSSILKSSDSILNSADITDQYHWSFDPVSGLVSSRAPQDPHQKPPLPQTII